MKSQVEKILSAVYPRRRDVVKKLEHHCRIDTPRMSIAKLLLTHSEEETTRIFSEYISKRRKMGTLTYYIEKYGEVDGELRYKEKNLKLSVGADSLRERGYSEDEIAAIKTRHSEKSTNTVDNMKRRYGEELGLQKFTEYESTFRHRSARCVEYWLLRGHTLESAKEHVSEHQKRDLQFFLDAGWTEDEYLVMCNKKSFGFSIDGYKERFGELEGPARRKLDSAKSSDIEYFRDRHGFAAGEEKYYAMLKGKASHPRNSNVQIEFATSVFSRLPPEVQTKFYGAPYTNDFWINLKDNEFGIKCCVPDIRIKNIIIEFDGTYWHSTKEVKLRDAQKEVLLAKLNYLVYRISEEEYRASPEVVIDRTVKFITDNIDFNFTQFKHLKE